MNKFFTKLTIFFSIVGVSFFFGLWWFFHSFGSEEWDRCRKPFVVYSHMFLKDSLENTSLDLFANGVQSTEEALVIDTFFDAKALWPDPFSFWKFSDPTKSIYKREKVIYLKEGSDFKFTFDVSGVCVNRQPSLSLNARDTKILWNETEIGDTFQIPQNDLPQEMLFQILWNEKFEYRFNIRLEWLDPEAFGEKQKEIKEDRLEKTDTINQKDTLDSLGLEVIRQAKKDMTIVQIDPKQYQAKIQVRETPALISSWAQESSETITINGSYFHEDFSPSGYLVVGGNRVGRRKFDEDKTGLLVIQNGMVQIRDLKINPIKPGERFEYALQSYPFLIKNGVGVIASDSGKKARRTAIGLDNDGLVYVILVNDATVSLYEFMKLLEGTGIPFREVLNLDGGPSSGLFLNFSEYKDKIDSQLPVPNILQFQRN